MYSQDGMGLGHLRRSILVPVLADVVQPEGREMTDVGRGERLGHRDHGHLLG